jgi:hypothetical protein
MLGRRIRTAQPLMPELMSFDVVFACELVKIIIIQVMIKFRQNLFKQEWKHCGLIFINL